MPQTLRLSWLRVRVRDGVLLVLHLLRLLRLQLLRIRGRGAAGGGCGGAYRRAEAGRRLQRDVASPAAVVVGRPAEGVVAK